MYPLTGRILPPAADAPGGTLGTVLVADDEPDILNALRDLLHAESPRLRVLAARSGPEALALMEEGQPDLILCDYRMPGMDGLEVLAEAYRREPLVPRVLMTAYADTPLAIRAINESAIDHFVAKPWDNAALVGAVERLLRESRAARLRERAMERARDAVRHLGELEPDERA